MTEIINLTTLEYDKNTSLDSENQTVKTLTTPRCDTNNGNQTVKTQNVPRCDTNSGNQSVKTQTVSRSDTNTAILSDYLKSTRWRVAYMGLFVGFFVYLYRININLALPSMVKSSKVNFQVTSSTPMVNSSKMMSHLYTISKRIPLDNSDTSGLDYYNGQVNTEDCVAVSAPQTDTLQDGEFSWDRQTQAFILSGYYYGYLISLVPFGWVSGKCGSKHLISFAMLTSAVVTLVLPALAKISAYAVVIIRIVLGICSGALPAGTYTLISRWALPEERSRFIGIIWFGQYLGTIIGYFTSGFLCANGFANGWGSVFYIHGTLGCLFVALWVYVIEEYPEHHPRISESELLLLRPRSARMDKAKNNKDPAVPWLRMLTYVPVLALITTHTLDGFIHYLVLTCLPLYMKDVLKFDIQSNGMYTSLPFVCSLVGLFVSGVFGDMMVSRKILTITATRKIVQVAALIGTAIGIGLPGLMTCSQRGLVIGCFCICMFFQATGYSAGYPATPVDIAPRYASVIFSISSSFCTVSGIVSPFAVAALTTNDTAAEWRVVFYIAAGCAVIAAVVFGLFSSSEVAPWAVDSETEIEVTVDADRPSLTQSLILAKRDVKNISVTEERIINDSN